MDDLIAFVTARLDEDEWSARGMEVAGESWELARNSPTEPDWTVCVRLDPLTLEGRADVWREDAGTHIARYHPARARREITAKRAILADHLYDDQACGHAIEGCPARRLTAVYSDHPDYRAEWAA